MSAYLTQAEFEALAEGWVTDDPAALARLLERASRAIDTLVPGRPTYWDGTFAGFKFDPADLDDQDDAALKRATAAQAEFMVRQGESELDGPRPSKVTGPDFSVDYTGAPGGARSRYSHLAMIELRNMRAIRYVGAVRARP